MRNQLEDDSIFLEKSLVACSIDDASTINTVDTFNTVSTDDSTVRPKVSSSSLSSVTFGSVQIREFNRIPGDHPNVQDGVPLTFDWPFIQNDDIPIDLYEHNKQHRRKVIRTKEELRLCSTTRSFILLQYFQIPQHKIFAAEKEVLRHRQHHKVVTPYETIHHSRMNEGEEDDDDEVPCHHNNNNNHQPAMPHKMITMSKIVDADDVFFFNETTTSTAQKKKVPHNQQHRFDKKHVVPDETTTLAVRKEEESSSNNSQSHKSASHETNKEEESEQKNLKWIGRCKKRISKRIIKARPQLKAKTTTGYNKLSHDDTEECSLEIFVVNNKGTQLYYV